jgi:hypothetical protein
VLAAHTVHDRSAGALRVAALPRHPRLRPAPQTSMSGFDRHMRFIELHLPTNLLGSAAADRSQVEEVSAVIVKWMAAAGRHRQVS